MGSDPAEITELLHAWRAGDRDAENRLFEIVLPDLRRLAQHYMRGERPGHSLEPTDLVDQIYLKLTGARDRDWQNRGHFFAIAARAMRRHLIDHARARPDAENVPVASVSETFAITPTRLDLAVEIEQHLEAMEKVNPVWCTIVELKFFLGLTDDEAAAVLDIHVRKLQREWSDARRWLWERQGNK
jgi:RNA polymerase sigma factor (TIGR02999 family)